MALVVLYTDGIHHVRDFQAESPLILEQEGAGELFPFMAQDRHEFGQWGLEVFTFLSISACNLIREVKPLFLGLAKEEKKKKLPAFSLLSSSPLYFAENA